MCIATTSSNNINLSELSAQIKSAISRADFKEFTAKGQFNAACLYPGLEYQLSNDEIDLRITAVEKKGSYGPIRTDRLEYLDKVSGKKVDISASYGYEQSMIHGVVVAFNKAVERKLNRDAAAELTQIDELVAQIPSEAWQKMSTDRDDKYRVHFQAEHNGKIVRLSKVTNTSFYYVRDSFEATIFISCEETLNKNQDFDSFMPRNTGSATVVEAREEAKLGNLERLYKDIIKNNPIFLKEEELKQAIPAIISSIPVEKWKLTSKPACFLDVDYRSFQKEAETERYEIRMTFNDYGLGHHWNFATLKVKDKEQDLCVTLPSKLAMELFRSVKCKAAVS